MTSVRKERICDRNRGLKLSFDAEWCFGTNLFSLARAIGFVVAASNYVFHHKYAICEVIKYLMLIKKLQKVIYGIFVYKLSRFHAISI